jgi:hypothetical protein
VKCNKPSLTESEALGVINLTRNDEALEEGENDEQEEGSEQSEQTAEEATGELATEERASGEESVEDDLEPIAPNQNRAAKTRKKVPIKNAKKRTNHRAKNTNTDNSIIPRANDENESENEEEEEEDKVTITVYKPFEQGQYPLYRETGEWNITQPCMCCFHSAGHVWNFRGTGMSLAHCSCFSFMRDFDFWNYVLFIVVF